MKNVLRLAAVACVLTLPLWSAPPAGAAFCNTTGFLVCDTANGKPCGTSANQRCVAPGICEWGVCICQSGSWNCFY